MVDHGLAKVQLQDRLAAEAEALRRARALIATGRATRLSDFQLEDPLAFAVLLDCLGASLAARLDPSAPCRATSTDGSLRIDCKPVPDAPMIALHGPDGVLNGPDLELTIAECW